MSRMNGAMRKTNDEMEAFVDRASRLAEQTFTTKIFSLGALEIRDIIEESEACDFPGPKSLKLRLADAEHYLRIWELQMASHQTWCNLQPPGPMRGKFEALLANHREKAEAIRARMREMEGE